MDLTSYAAAAIGFAPPLAFMDIVELEGAGCCPAPGVIKSFETDAWLAIAARNLALAQNKGADIITICNGCYGSLFDAAHILHNDPEKLRAVNKILREVGMFEWVYFARPDSVIDGREVYDVRKTIGKVLAREQPAEADVVIPVPDSGRAHALGYSLGSGIRYDEGLMKNRYVERTFIMP